MWIVFFFLIGLQQCSLVVYGGSVSNYENIQFVEVIDSGDGSVIALGNMDMPSKIFLTKLSLDGAVDWIKTYSSGIGEAAHSIVRLSDSYVILGSEVVSSSEIILIKTDFDGNSILQKKWTHGEGFTIPTSLVDLNDGTVAFSGTMARPSGVNVGVFTIMPYDLSTITFDYKYGGGGNSVSIDGFGIYWEVPPNPIKPWFSFGGVTNNYGIGSYIYMGAIWDNINIYSAQDSAFVTEGNLTCTFHSFDIRRYEPAYPHLWAVAVISATCTSSNENTSMVVATWRNYNGHYMREISFSLGDSYGAGCHFDPNFLDRTVVCVGKVRNGSVFDLVIVKLDPFGGLIWAKVLPNDKGDDEISRSTLSEDGKQVIISGTTTSTDNGKKEGFFMVLDIDAETCGLVDITDQTVVSDIPFVYTSMTIEGKTSIAGDRSAVTDPSLTVSTPSPTSFSNNQTCYGCGSYHFDSPKVCSQAGVCSNESHTCQCSNPETSFGPNCDDKTLFFEFLGSDEHEYIGDAIETSDGGILIGGVSEGFHVSKMKQIYFIKLDHQGKIQWAKSYGTSVVNSIHRIVETRDGQAFLFLGRDHYPSFLIGKLDLQGGLVWAFVHNSMANSVWSLGYDILEDPSDETVVIVGSFKHWGGAPNKEEGLACKLFLENGTIFWAKRYNQPAAHDMIARPFRVVDRVESDGSLVVGGALDYDWADRAMMIAKLDSMGNVIWIRAYYFGSCAGDITTLRILEDESGIIAAGSSSSNYRMCIFRAALDTGFFEWGSIYWDSNYAYELTGIEETYDDGGIIVAGSNNHASSKGGVLFHLDKRNGLFERHWSTIAHPSFGTADRLVGFHRSGSGFTVAMETSNYGGKSAFAVGRLDQHGDMCNSGRLQYDGSLLEYHKPPIPVEKYCTGDFTVEDKVFSHKSSAILNPVDQTGKTSILYADCYSCTGNPSQRLGPPYGCNTCFGVNETDPDHSTCYGHGNCVKDDTCFCQDSFYGKYCNISSCQGIPANESAITCGGPNGECTGQDKCVCHDPNTIGKFCEIMNCFGAWGNETEQVCSGHGNCSSLDTCSCAEGYYGTQCNVTQCFGVWNNVSSVAHKLCSGNGGCEVHDKCDCLKNFYGEFCNITTCYGYFSNDSATICSGNGYCAGFDICQCTRDNYYGDLCNITSCYGLLANETNVCSGYGDCIDFSTCKCSSGYFGSFCNVTTCDTVFSNYTSACNEKYGICWPEDVCSCETQYFGEFCNVTNCFGVISNDSEHVCSGYGKCFPLDRCACENSLYFGPNCNYTFCDGIPSNLTEQICFGHGKCFPYETCNCNSEFFGVSCNITTCNNIFSNDTTTKDAKGKISLCSSHGICYDHNECHCSPIDRYFGRNCEVNVCFGILSNESSKVCHGNGNCTEFETCECDPHYFEEDCNITTCFDVFSNESRDSDLCNGHGKCIAYDKCQCDEHYEGTNCQNTECVSGKSTDEDVCSNHGNCTEFNFCECDDGYEDESGDCYLIQHPNTPSGTKEPGPGSGSGSIVAGVIGGSVGFVVVLGVLLCCFCCIFCGIACCCVLLFCTILGSSVFVFVNGGIVKRKNLSQQELFVLDETAVETDNRALAKIKINKSLFKIKIREIKLKKILGKGGSNSTVYLADFKGTDVAFKAFKTTDLCGSQILFDEFENEVTLLSSISHPNTLRFYGAILKPPRVGIVMEFCPNGDLVYYVGHKTLDGESLPVEEKIRLLFEIAQAMRFLHSRKVIHRDLKPENVLIDIEEHCKVMDFGSSKLVERMSRNKTTRLGTPTYMSPEITLGNGDYDGKVDVFSFGVMIFTVMSEIFSPYFGVPCVELKVANNSEFRPDFEKADLAGIQREEIQWMIDLAKSCWEHESSERPSFEQICDVFEENGGNECRKQKSFEKKEIDSTSSSSGSDVSSEEEEELEEEVGEGSSEVEEESDKEESSEESADDETSDYESSD